NTNVSYDWFVSKFGSWSNAILESGIIKKGEVIYKGLTKSHYIFNDNGDLCRSVPEVKISNIFIDNNLEYKYDGYYYEFIPNINSNIRYDWKITHNGKEFYVEYFGLYDGRHNSISFNYRIKAKEKLELIKNNNIDNFVD